MTLTQSDIIKQISHRLDFSKSDAKILMESLLEIMKSTLASGEDIIISGFGKFQVNDKAPRKGRNPATGEDWPGNRKGSFINEGQKNDKLSLRKIWIFFIGNFSRIFVF